MKTYKIILTSWVLWILILVASIFVGGTLFHAFLPKNNTPIFIIALILLFVFIFLTQRFISMATVEVILSDDKLSIKWLKQFIFQNRPDREISFSEIEEYKIQPDNHFNLFKLTLKDRTEIRMWHFVLTYGDDYNKFITAFPLAVNYFNKHGKSITENKLSKKENKSTESKIKEAKTIFESDAAPILAVFAVVLVIAVPLILIANTTSNSFLGLGPMAGGVFFLIQYWQYHRKRGRNKAED